MKSSLLQLIASSRFDQKSDSDEVSEREGSYKGIRPEALYNTFEDFLSIFSSPFIGGKFIDLGCGTGLSCLLYSALFPDRESIGIEFELSRLTPAKQFVEENDLQNCSFLHADLLESKIPVGDTYFLYFPTGLVLDKILTELYIGERKFRLVVVESHGDLIGRIQKENWLQEIGEISLHSPRHYPKAIVYERNFLKRRPSLLPHEISFQEKYLILRDQCGEWVADSYGLEWSGGENYDLRHPPRRIMWIEVIAIRCLEDFPLKIRELLNQRKRGGFINGEIIRKIYLNTPEVELSSGERINLDKDHL